MKAVAVFPKEKKSRVIDVEPPKLTDGAQVKLRMLESGVCGTDREVASCEYGQPPDGCDYLIQGHESLGRVVEVGTKVGLVAVGDLVVPMVRRPCPENCPACAHGRSDLCYTGHFTERGINRRHGYWAEEVVISDECYVVKVPEALRHVAVLLEPLTIAEKGLMILSHILQRTPWEVVARRE